MFTYRENGSVIWKPTLNSNISKTCYQIRVDLIDERGDVEFEISSCSTPQAKLLNKSYFTATLYNKLQA